LSAREPIFNVPAAVIGLLAILVGIHALRSFLSPEQDTWFVLAMAFIPARYAGYAAELPGGDTAAATSFLSHMLVHGDIVHLTFNAAWLLAFGAVIARRIGSVRFLLFAALTGIAGALTFLAVNPGLMAPVIGASGAVAGLMGGTMRFLFKAIDGGGFWRLRHAPETVPLMTLPEALSDRRVQATTAVWLLLNLLALFGIGTMGAQGGIAWEAHVGGYLAGLLGFGLFDAPRPAPLPDQPTLH
jgi:membrane associated rhomboid family serine protease